MKELIDNLEKASTHLSSIADKCLELAKKGDKWTCIYCDYVIIVGDNKQKFAKKIRIHINLCLSKLYQNVLKRMEKTDK